MLTTFCPLLTTYLVDNSWNNLLLLLEGKICIPLTFPLNTTYLPRHVNIVKERPIKEKRGLSLWQFLVRPTTLSTWLNVEKVEKSRCFWQYGKCSQSNMLWIFFSSWKHSCEIVGPNKKWLKKEKKIGSCLNKVYVCIISEKEKKEPRLVITMWKKRKLNTHSFCDLSTITRLDYSKLVTPYIIQNRFSVKTQMQTFTW